VQRIPDPGHFRAGPDDDALAGTERRIISTLLGVRGEVDTLSASVDVLAALVDTLAKLLLVHLPEPSRDESEAITASALGRYESCSTRQRNPVLTATARGQSSGSPSCC